MFRFLGILLHVLYFSLYSCCMPDYVDEIRTERLLDGVIARVAAEKVEEKKRILSTAKRELTVLSVDPAFSANLLRNNFEGCLGIVKNSLTTQIFESNDMISLSCSHRVILRRIKDIIGGINLTYFKISYKHEQQIDLDAQARKMGFFHTNLEVAVLTIIQQKTLRS